MNIIILGAGQVGGTLAENLVYEKNDVTVIDINGDKLQQLQQRLDIRTIQGFAAYPEVLLQAGIHDADMLIAVTNSDEINLIACRVAYQLFNTPLKLARIRSNRYIRYQEKLFSAETFSVDFCISPEVLVTEQIARLIEYPGALQVLEFADGIVRLIAVRSNAGGTLVGKTLNLLQKTMPDVLAQVVAIYRELSSIPLTPATTIEIGDEIFILVAGEQIDQVMQAIRTLERPYRNIMIAGGGNIGARLAQYLERNYRVKLIEQRVERCQYLAEVLQKTTVLHGDTTDRNLLLDENIDCVDVFIAVTNDDEVNIMASIQAKRLGVSKAITLITRSAYVDLIEGGNIDIAISPQQATIGSILAQIRRGDIVKVHSLRRGAAEAIEVIAHGDNETSEVVGRAIKNLNLPKGASIGAIVRNQMLILPEPETKIETNDHVIIFVIEKRSIQDVERLFEVNIAFL